MGVDFELIRRYRGNTQYGRCPYCNHLVDLNTGKRIEAKITGMLTSRTCDICACLFRKPMEEVRGFAVV